MYDGALGRLCTPAVSAFWTLGRAVTAHCPPKGQSIAALPKTTQDRPRLPSLPSLPKLPRMFRLPNFLEIIYHFNI